MPNHFLSKKDHLHHYAKIGQFKLGQALMGGALVDPSEHERLRAMHNEGDKTEHLYLCAVCKKTYTPAAPPDNNDLRLWMQHVLLPTGEFMYPDLDHQQRPMLIVIGIGPCCSEVRDSLAAMLSHDWNTVDHLGNPLPQSE